VSRLKWLIDEKLVMLAIVLNAVALCLTSTAQSATVPWPALWPWVDYVCVLYFTLEIAIKLQLVGRDRFFADGWNRFDFFIVAGSLPVLLMPFIDTHGFYVLSLFRVGRLVRALRLLRFIPGRDHIAEGIWRALKASVGIFLGVVILNFIAAMCANMLFGHIAPEFFGSPLKACYTMFQIFTLEGWPEVSQVIAARTTESMAFLARVFFVCTVFGGGVIGLSLANAVFVDQMVSDNNDDLEKAISDLSDQVTALRRELQDR